MTRAKTPVLEGNVIMAGNASTRSLEENATVKELDSMVQTVLGVRDINCLNWGKGYKLPKLG